MENIRALPITNHTELRHRIMHLNAKRVAQEDDLKHDIKELYYSIHPATLLNKAFNTDSDTGSSNGLAKAGLGIGTDFLIGKLVGRSSSIKGFISSLVLEKVAGYVINNHADTITAGIGKIKGFFTKDKSTV
ncbi:MAG: hypothetical protein M3R27_01670 [Bacteroidota bacterium]|nr:hypothetical protein [Bacteroidota bacterium]